MSTKLYDKKTAAFAAFVIQAMPEGLTEEAMDGWMKNAPVLKKFLAGLVPGKNLFIITTATATAATKAKPTKDCFTGPTWRYRESSFDTWLPKSQSKKGAAAVAILELTKSWTFVELAQAILGVTTSDCKELGRLLKERGHTLTLTQAQDLAERTEAGEVIGLNTDGFANFFFMETGNEDAPVAVGHVVRSDMRYWDACVSCLDDVRRWGVERRFLLCNAGASKL